MFLIIHTYIHIPTDPSVRQFCTVPKSEMGTQHSPMRHFFDTSMLNRFIV